MERRDCEIKRVERNDFKKKRMAGRCCTVYVRGWQGVAYWVQKRVARRGCTGYGRGWKGVAVLGTEWWQGMAVLDTEEGGKAWLYWIYGRGC